MESLNINGTINNAFINGNYNSEIEVNGNFPNGEPVDNSDVDGTPTYADAFPPLSSSAGTSISKQPVWGQGNAAKVKQAGAPKAKILSSSTTQVSLLNF